MSEFVFKNIGQLDAAAAKTGDELLEVFQDGVSKKMSINDLIKFSSYDVGTSTSTSLDLNNTVFTIDNTTASAKSITMPANLAAGRARTFVVVVRGKAGAVTWDSSINWNGGNAPTLANTLTVAVLLWDGISITGSTGASY